VPEWFGEKARTCSRVCRGPLRCHGVFRIGIGQFGKSDAHPFQWVAEGFDLEEATIQAILQDQQSGRRTARQIAEQYLARIQALDRTGPSLKSSRSTWTRSPSPTRSMPSAAPTGRAGRFTAFRF
jgi:hypothetical protein